MSHTNNNSRSNSNSSGISNVSNNQLSIYHDNLQVILHNQEKEKIVLWDPNSKQISIKSTTETHDGVAGQIVIKHNYGGGGVPYINSNNLITAGTDSISSSSASVTSSSSPASNANMNPCCPLCKRSWINNNNNTSMNTNTSNNRSNIQQDLDNNIYFNRQPSSYMTRDYFLLLGSADNNNNNATSSNYKIVDNNSNNNAGDTDQNHSFFKEYLNVGYYKKFFKETSKIGSGGFGAVYHCKHLISNIDLGEYAVKKVPVGENLPWFYRVLKEVKALETLQKHKNIINYKHSWLEYSQPDFGPTVPYLYILMEYANSGNLQDFMEQRELTENEIWSFFIDLCHGIGYLHHSNIIHRDLKPQNILLHQSYDPVCDYQVTHLMISDFGTCDTIGQQSEDLASAARGKRSGNTGTLDYVAPELFEIDVVTGEYTARGDEKCDIWSLGILLYEMAYNKLPFKHAGDPFLDRDPNRDIDMLIDEISSFSDSTFSIPTNPPRSKELKETISVLLRRNPLHRPTINQILSTPFVQSKTNQFSLNPIIMTVESPSLRKRNRRKRNIKRSKESIHEEEEELNDKQPTMTSTTTTTTTKMTSKNTSTIIFDQDPINQQNINTNQQQQINNNNIKTNSNQQSLIPVHTTNQSTSTTSTSTAISSYDYLNKQLSPRKRKQTNVNNNNQISDNEEDEDEVQDDDDDDNQPNNVNTHGRHHQHLISSSNRLLEYNNNNNRSSNGRYQNNRIYNRVFTFQVLQILLLLLHMWICFNELELMDSRQIQTIFIYPVVFLSILPIITSFRNIRLQFLQTTIRIIWIIAIVTLFNQTMSDHPFTIIFYTTILYIISLIILYLI